MLLKSIHSFGSTFLQPFPLSLSECSHSQFNEVEALFKFWYPCLWESVSDFWGCILTHLFDAHKTQSQLKSRSLPYGPTPNWKTQKRKCCVLWGAHFSFFSCLKGVGEFLRKQKKTKNLFLFCFIFVGETHSFLTTWQLHPYRLSLFTFLFCFTLSF